MRHVLVFFTGFLILAIPATSFSGDCGDVDNSGSINLLDITYLIAYVYKGGPEPNCGPETGTVTDIDGNVYQTIKIGGQWWMVENLKVTHYRNGDPIPDVMDAGEWSALSTGAYCSYDNDEDHVSTYGCLYNWYAVDDSRSIAPQGWHVPSDAEWKQLEKCLGMSQTEADSIYWRGTDEGGKLKEAGTAHWNSPNTGATNESGFTALPGGYRYGYGTFNSIGYSGFFWSSTEYTGPDVWCRNLSCHYAGVHRYYDDKQSGFSVRCVRD
jgi:uncharacterized protein (TIGR02145 family)